MASGRAGSNQITDTGIRIVGKAAADLVAQAAASGLEPPAPADLVWAGTFRARPRIGSGSAVPAMLQQLTDSLREAWDACPALTRDHPVNQPASRFGGITWSVRGDAGAWQGELIWRHRHPVLAGIACTTYLLINEQQHQTLLTMAVACDNGLKGARGFAGAGQARPVLLDAIRRSVALTDDGYDGTPRYLSDADMDSFVSDVLLGDRPGPVAVLAPLENEGYLVPPDELARDLFGLAPLYVMERQSCTFALTDAIGDRRLSAYFGALRIYQAGFTCADSGAEHWLLLRDRVEDPVERAGLIGRLGVAAAANLGMLEGLRRRDEVPPPPAAAPRAGQQESVDRSGATEAVPAPHPLAPPEGDGGLPPGPAMVPTGRIHLPELAELPGVLQSLSARIGDLAGTIAHLVAANAQLSDEIARLRTATAVRATSTHALERRLSAIETLLDPGLGEEQEPAEGSRDVEHDEDSASGPTLLEVVQHAGSEFSETLLMLDSAEQSAADSPYQDSDRVAAVLNAMAFVANRRQEGSLGTGLRAAFQELGIDYRAGIAKSTSEKLRQQYLFTGQDGQQYECYEHIAIGGTYDPKRCLRIYFSSRVANESRFVIGHVGRHLTGMSST